MEATQFSGVRHYLGKTQNQLAQLLCVSPKAIQAFEQGWRNVPASAERQLLFLLFLKRSLDGKNVLCWKVKRCSVEWRNICPAWQFKAGNFCWFINGTLCRGEVQRKWRDKIAICQQCEVFLSVFQDF